MLKLGDLYRKTFHMGNMIFPLSYWFLIDNKTDMVIIIGSLLFVSLLIYVLRTKVELINHVFRKWFFVMMKSKEKSGKLTGATWVMLGVFLTVVLFPRTIAIPAMLFLSVGDSFAAIIGLKYGRISIGNKTLEGTLAGLFMCLIVASLYDLIPIKITIIGAITAMLIEVLPISIDDNIRIPVFSGAIMYCLFTFGIF